MPYLVPDKLTAGMDVSWEVVLPAYSPAEWTLTLVLRGAGKLDIEASAQGAAYRLEIEGVQTGALPPGRYSWGVLASNAGRVVEIDRGVVEVLPDLRQIAAGHDPRSHAEKVLANIEAVLENRATVEQKSYKINNRELQRTSLDELTRLRKLYRREVAAEQAGPAGRRRLGRVHLARFTS